MSKKRKLEQVQQQTDVVGGGHSSVDREKKKKHIPEEGDYDWTDVR